MVIFVQFCTDPLNSQTRKRLSEQWGEKKADKWLCAPGRAERWEASDKQSFSEAQDPQDRPPEHSYTTKWSMAHLRLALSQEIMLFLSLSFFVQVKIQIDNVRKKTEGALLSSVQ